MITWLFLDSSRWGRGQASHHSPMALQATLHPCMALESFANWLCSHRCRCVRETPTTLITPRQRLWQVRCCVSEMSQNTVTSSHFPSERTLRNESLMLAEGKTVFCPVRMQGLFMGVEGGWWLQSLPRCLVGPCSTRRCQALFSR